MNENALVPKIAELPLQQKDLHDSSWRSIADWLEGVGLNEGREDVGPTAQTYAYHLAKFRWYCDHVVRRAPLQWTRQDANQFIRYLRELPAEAICAKTAEEGRQPRAAKRGEAGYTPFRKQPSTSAQADIVRCIKSLYRHLQADGEIRINPFGQVRAKKGRRADVSRAVEPELLSWVIAEIDRCSPQTSDEHRINARDRFALVAIRELGLRASELTQSDMSDFQVLSDPKSKETYWIMRVREEVAKGGKEREVPVTVEALDALICYRKAFGLSATPKRGEKRALLLSTKTAPLAVGDNYILSAKDRKFFGSWGEIRCRKTLYAIVKRRLADAASALKANGRSTDAETLTKASPHWLRHTFAKSNLLQGGDIRMVASLLGHSGLGTVMDYTNQDALDQIRAYEQLAPGRVARLAGTL